MTEPVPPRGAEHARVSEGEPVSWRVTEPRGWSARLRRLTTAPASSYKRPADRQRIAAAVRQMGPQARVVNVGAKLSSLGTHVINLDVRLFPGVDVVGDAMRLPFRDGCLDGIVTQGVLEHVRHPEDAVREILRTLRPGGLTYHEAPFIQGYHADPWDFHRFTLEGLKAHFDGFEIVDAGVILGPSSGFAWVLREYLAILFAFNNPYLYAAGKRVFGWLTFPVKYMDALLARGRYAPKLASAVYVLARKPAASPGARDGQR